VSRAGLVQALQQKAAEDVEALWQAARAEADKLRVAAAREVDAQRLTTAQRVTGAAQRFERVATAAAEREAWDIRTSTAVALAERLHRLALAELPGLRAQHREELFSGLAGELPARSWQQVRVNPADEALARRYFPQASIEGDPRISGGMEARAEGGRICVNNTLEARLETVWPELVTRLIRTILSETADDQAPARH